MRGARGPGPRPAPVWCAASRAAKSPESATAAAPEAIRTETASRKRCSSKDPPCLRRERRPGAPSDYPGRAKLPAVERKYVLKTPARLKSYRVDYDRELNDEQRDVVLAGGGPILVIAGAGSGKTRTLVYRVSRLIESGHDPSRILLLTFTNKAAREMLAAGRDAARGRHPAADGRHVPLRRQPDPAALRHAARALRRTSRFSIPRTRARCSRPPPPTGGSRPSSGASPRATCSSTSTRTRSTPAGPSPRSSPSTRRTFRELETDIVSVFQRYRERKRAGQRLRLRRPAPDVEAPARRGPGGGRAALGLLRPRPRRRVPGHQPPPGRDRGRHGAGQEATSRSSATTRRRSTPSAAPPSRTSSGSRSATRRRRRSA